ncbi:MAG TPA: c-type cytochrome biogenesis protein CcmI [Burkholderiaceae bacterium]|nr:c-type cytochrome biogenesis protein CcmI [Burkholderiaceae bacterium]
MLTFWLLAAALIALVLALVLPALWRARAPTADPDARAAALAVHRDQWQEAEHDVRAGALDPAQLAAARAEIDRRAREEAATPLGPAGAARRTAWVVALAVPLLCIGLYLYVGEPQALQPLPPSADRLADEAEAIVMATGGRFAGEAARKLDAALALDPKHVKALALGGVAAFEAGDRERAKALWLRLLDVLPPEAPLAQAIRERLGGDAPPSAAVPGAGTISGELSLAPALAARVAPDDRLFIVARAVQGPRVPLAVSVRRAGELPLAFTLDDSMAMAPQAKLSTHDGEVVVVARISKSGQAAPQAGDLAGESAPVKPGAKGVRLVIERVQP